MTIRADVVGEKRRWCNQVSSFFKFLPDEDVMIPVAYLRSVKKEEFRYREREGGKRLNQ